MRSGRPPKSGRSVVRTLRPAILVVMLAGAWFVTRGELSAGGFVGFLLLVNVFFPSLFRLR